MQPLRALHCLAFATLLAGVAGSTAACSAFVSSRQTVTVRASPAEAEISVDGEHVGRGQVKLELERDRAHLVVARHGGNSVARVIDHGWSTLGKLDALASIVILFPGIGLFFSGARSLEPRELDIAVR